MQNKGVAHLNLPLKGGHGGRRQGPAVTRLPKAQEKRSFSARMGSRRALFALGWRGRSIPGPPLALQSRGGAWPEPNGGKFSRPVTQAEGRTRSGSRLQGQFLVFTHVKGKMRQLAHCAWSRQYFNTALNYLYLV